MEDKQLTFEAALKRLEDIVAALENSKTPLEQAIALFEEGVTLTKQCQTILASAETKVNLLINGKSQDFVSEE